MRYERQETLKQIGREGQRRLKESTAAVVGLGSTGTVAAELLARAGVGKLLLFDHDLVEKSNLSRQLLYSEDDIGKPKALAAKERLESLNGEVKVESASLHVAYNTINIQADVILDCTDNMQTRLLINDYSRRKGVPWIYCGAVGCRGMIYVTDGSPCFNCVFENVKAFETCEEVGILNAVSTMAASIQVTEAVKILLGEKPVSGLISFNIWDNDYRVFKAASRNDCNACNGNYRYLSSDKEYSIEYCKSKAAMSSKPLKDMKLDLESVKKSFEVKADAGIVAVIEVEGVETVVHDYGELIFKNEKNEDKLNRIASTIYEAGT